MSLAMSVAEREQFLAQVHVGVLAVAAAGGRAPLAVPVWYSYRPGGEISVITARDSRKAAAIRAAGRLSICAQDETPPYKYVSVEGPVVVMGAECDAAERLAMARRYLGAEGGAVYTESNPDPEGINVVFRMRPERWVSADFSEPG